MAAWIVDDPTRAAHVARAAERLRIVAGTRHRGVRRPHSIPADRRRRGDRRSRKWHREDPPRADPDSRSRHTADPPRDARRKDVPRTVDPRSTVPDRGSATADPAHAPASGPAVKPRVARMPSPASGSRVPNAAASASVGRG